MFEFSLIGSPVTFAPVVKKVLWLIFVFHNKNLHAYYIYNGMVLPSEILSDSVTFTSISGVSFNSTSPVLFVVPKHDFFFGRQKQCFKHTYVH